MQFFLPVRIPTRTHQEKRIVIRKGKPQVYEDADLKEARAKYEAHLARFAPEKPMTGPVELHVVWCFPVNRKHKIAGEPKVTRPDTDNLIKLFKDCMTRTGFWVDDAQVYREINEKYYSSTEGIFVEVKEEENACW